VTEVIPASVLIPTIGRPLLLERCLHSLGDCDPRPSEILVVDQSAQNHVSRVVEHFSGQGARLIRSGDQGRAQARNLGLREAVNEIVLSTDDDCTVSPSWVGIAFHSLSASSTSMIVTGRVLPAGDPRAVPSMIDEPAPSDYVRPMDCGKLYAGNMACRRSLVLELGGFDERIRPAAEDVDFCYRWLSSGRVLRYEPSLLVHHHAWRTTRQLEELYVEYAQGLGVFLAKHLRHRDLRALRLLAHAGYEAMRGTGAAAIRGRPRWTDPRQGILRGLPRGLVSGWRTYEPGTEDAWVAGAHDHHDAPDATRLNK
jgi:GT2 family glycosyltransferase